MNKIVLSTIAALTIGTVSLSAMQFYVDDKGQVFIHPAANRTALDMSDMKETTKKVQMSEAEKKKIRAEIKEEVLAEVKTQKEAMKKDILADIKKDSILPSIKRITIMDEDSPEFLLGKQTKINMKFIADDNPEMWLKAGVRIQGTMESKEIDYQGSGKEETDEQDAYLRRVRLEIAAGFGHGISYTMDIRNDKSNYGIENDEGKFSVGDAYVKIKKPFDTSLINFKLYRAKIDVSRTETVKSARVIAYDRPYVADVAAQYISFNRRGANIQMYGDWEKKVHYQVAFGSATSPDKIKDATGGKMSSAAEVKDQSFFYGGKLVLSPFDGWEETQRTETYFGKGKHFEIGAGYWNVPSMEGTVTTNNTDIDYDLNHQLINLEASMHYKGLFLQGEYFKFKDAVQSWEHNDDGTPLTSSDKLNTGDASGWYVTGEYVMPEYGYIAPFARYESFDMFEKAGDAKVTSLQAGLNWYLKGNTIKAGIYYQKDSFGEDAADNHIKDGAGNITRSYEKEVQYIRLTSQFFF